MGGFTQTIRAALLDHYFGKSTLTPPAALYVGLFTVSPGSDGSGGTEVPATNGYARVATAPSDWNTANAGDPATLDNANPVTFPAATGGPWASGSDIVAAGLFTAASGGTPVAFGNLSVAKPILENDVANYAAGDIDVTLAGS